MSQNSAIPFHGHHVLDSHFWFFFQFCIRLSPNPLFTITTKKVEFGLVCEDDILPIRFSFINIPQCKHKTFFLIYCSNVGFISSCSRIISHIFETSQHSQFVVTHYIHGGGTSGSGALYYFSSQYLCCVRYFDFLFFISYNFIIISPPFFSCPIVHISPFSHSFRISYML